MYVFIVFYIFPRIAIHYEFVCYLILNKMLFTVTRRVFNNDSECWIHFFVTLLHSKKQKVFITSNHQRIDKKLSMSNSEIIVSDFSRWYGTPPT